MPDATFEGERKSHSQIRVTRQPAFLRVRVASLSRATFRVSFAAQKSALFFGSLEWPGFGHRCQKQPSTKTASRCFGKTKSGFPKSGHRRRQPVILDSRKISINRSSVSLFPLPRMRDITSLRFFLVKTSAISTVSFFRAGAPTQGFR